MTVPLQQAVQTLVESDATNKVKIASLEKQIDDMLKSLEENRTQNIETTKNQVQIMSETLKEHIDNLITTYQEENNEKLKQIEDKRSIDTQNIFAKLEEITQRMDAFPQTVKLKYTKEEEQSIKPNNDKTTTNNFSNMITPIQKRPYEALHFPMESETQRSPALAQPVTLNGVRHSIIIPPASAAPAFYGKQKESPTQFLIRVEEYAESVHAWDRDTLLKGISQFLRDSALEWHCQLRLSPNRPTTWFEFKEAFLNQFNSPVRKARQEQEWHECKQKEDETINEFLVRLRALWREQKPKETEADLVKHLFCRMRNDLLNMLGVRRNAPLEEVMYEVQQIEDVLYRRAKGERLAKQLKQVSLTKDETTPVKKHNAYYSRGTTSRLNQEDHYNRYTDGRNFQINAVTPNYRPSNRNLTTADAKWQTQMQSTTCYTCGNYGHWKKNCPMSSTIYSQETSTPISKNEKGALGGRAS